MDHLHERGGKGDAGRNGFRTFLPSPSLAHGRTAPFGRRGGNFLRQLTRVLYNDYLSLSFISPILPVVPPRPSMRAMWGGVDRGLNLSIPPGSIGGLMLRGLGGEKWA